MKKIRLLGLLLVLVIALSSLSSCKDTSDNSNDSSSGSYVEKPEFTVTFDSNGGSSISPMTVYRNTQLPEITPPTRDDYVFTGWTYEGKEWMFGEDGDYVRDDITLYANWAKLNTIFKCEEIDGKIMLTKLINKDDFSSITLPEKFNGMPVTSIGAEVFKSFTVNTDDNLYKGLKSVTFPSTLTSIGESAFEKCTNLNVTFKGAITELGENAFYNCNVIKSIALGEGLKNIPFRAFSSCPITSIIIPDSLETVGENAFELSLYLQTAVIPVGAKVEDSAFRECLSLKTIFFRGDEAQFASLQISGNNTPLKDAKVYYYSEQTNVENDKFWKYNDNGAPTITVK